MGPGINELLCHHCKSNTVARIDPWAQAELRELVVQVGDRQVRGLRNAHREGAYLEFRPAVLIRIQTVASGALMIVLPGFYR
jgi:hypothetical protein